MIYKLFIPSPPVVIVVGVGGTGGYLVPLLARYLSLRHSDVSIILIDGDIVEEKNVYRQNFILSDIGRNKAQVLAERYSIFGKDIRFFPNYITCTKDILDIVYMIGHINGSYTSLLISCVDNIKTRQIIDELFQTRYRPQFFYIDSGNDELSGQVVLGAYPGLLSLAQLLDSSSVDPSVPLIFNSPSLLDRYPHLLSTEDKLPTEMSCEELAISQPQTIGANMTAATIIFNMVQQIYENGFLEYTEVDFNLNTGDFIKIPNTPEAMDPNFAARILAERIAQKNNLINNFLRNHKVKSESSFSNDLRQLLTSIDNLT